MAFCIQALFSTSIIRARQREKFDDEGLECERFENLKVGGQERDFHVENTCCLRGLLCHYKDVKHGAYGYGNSGLYTSRYLKEISLRPDCSSFFHFVSH
jgi:hypothetical protein